MLKLRHASFVLHVYRQHMCAFSLFCSSCMYLSTNMEMDLLKMIWLILTNIKYQKEKRFFNKTYIYGVQFLLIYDNIRSSKISYLNSLRPIYAYMLGNLTIIGSDNGLSPDRRKAII